MCVQRSPARTGELNLLPFGPYPTLPMSPAKHAEISQRRHGGQLDDYLPIHSFLDATKELCSDNRHRILHTLWGIRRVVVPVFGNLITNSEGKAINVKDLCEKDHVLPDYHNRFIPTLGDFCAAIDEAKLPADYRSTIDQLHVQYTDFPDISELLLSPLYATGQMKSLLVTHNSWFLGQLLPRLYPDAPGGLRECPLSPAHLFGAMSFRPWMDNGAGWPPSTAGLRPASTTLQSPISTNK